MKHTFKLWALAAVVPVAVFAQTQNSLDEEVNAELDRMYQKPAATAPRAKSSPAVQVNVQAQPTVTTTQSNYQGATQGAGQTATVAQTAGQVQYQAVKQPTTVIEASPLTESRADKIRKNRQDAELSTEQTIVEKLEQSRLEDEKRRAEVLFGDKFNTLMNQGQTQAQPAPAPVPVAQPVYVQPAPQPQPQVIPVVMPEQNVQPAPVVREEKEDKLDREAIRSEVSAALSEFKTEEKPKSKSYVSFMVGSGDYPDAVNVKGQYSMGIGFGKKFDDRLVGEGSFLYSNYQVEQPPSMGGGCVQTSYYGGCEYYPRITEMNQYGLSGLVKYQLLGGTVRPEVGGVLTYNYRTFTDKQFALTDATVSSQALDFGLMTGASLEMSEGFSLGLDYRYMWNMTNKVDGTSLQKSAIYGQSNYTPIEQLSYWNLSVVGRATF